MVALPVFARRTMYLLFGVKNLESEDGKPVDDETGTFGVQGSCRLMGNLLKQGEIDLLGEIVAELVEAIDAVLDLGDGMVGSVRSPSLIFAVPEIVVGLVLIEDKVIKGIVGLRRPGFRVMAVRSGLVVKRDDESGIEHWGACLG